MKLLPHERLDLVASLEVIIMNVLAQLTKAERDTAIKLISRNMHEVDGDLPHLNRRITDDQH